MELGVSVSRAHKTWSRSFLFKDFLFAVVRDYQFVSELHNFI